MQPPFLYSTIGFGLELVNETIVVVTVCISIKNEDFTCDERCSAAHEVLFRPITFANGEYGSRVTHTTPAPSLSSFSPPLPPTAIPDRKSTRLNSSHLVISYAVFCLKK